MHNADIHDSQTLADRIQRRIDASVAAGDKDSLERLLDELYEPAPETEQPFGAAIQLRPEIRRQLAEVALESNAALNWANKIARASRRVSYQTKVAAGFDGMHIVEEGDSWTQYPLLLADIVDQLSADPDKAIFSLGAAGDLLEDMAARREYIPALTQTAARILLLSGGGNDILGDGRFADLLLPYAEGEPARNLLNRPRLDAELRKVLAAYRTILGDVRRNFPRVRVLGHAYDVPYPQDSGRWIGKPLAERGIPLAIGRTVVRLVLERFAAELRGLEQEFDNFRYVDLHGKVDAGKPSWFDELHPKNAGYARAAAEFRKAIGSIAAEMAMDAGAGSAAVGAPEGASVSPADAMAGPRLETTPGVPLHNFEKASRAVIVLDPGHGGQPGSNVGGSSGNNAVGPGGTLEKTLTLDVARRARRMLESHGHRVLLTRDSDVNLSLRDRAGVAKNNDAAVFVSIHFNASTGHNAQGTETFVHTSHSDGSRRLCLAVQKAMVAELGLADRNAGHPGRVKTAEFGVINSAHHSPRTAAVLYEVSFLDRSEEERKLSTEAYRERIAGALARGIEAYLGAGVESAGLEAAVPAEIGDAIELMAVDTGFRDDPGAATAGTGSGMSREVDQAVEAASGWMGGHGLAFEADPGGDTGLARQIAESLARDQALDAGSAHDLGEFADVEIGCGFDVCGMGFDVEADTQALARVFAGVESAGFDMARYEAFIRSLGLRHFVPAKFLFLGSGNAPGSSCSGRNSLPPQDLWANIAKTARMLDEIRGRLGTPIRILSCYRNAAYNACIGGAARSQHMYFNAIDWRCDSGTVDLWHQTAREVRRSDPDFSGGIGLYRRQGFIHVDTRGTDVDWA